MLPGGVVSKAHWPLVGRDGELALFRSLLADSACRGVLICGPSGVGKTRLAEEFLTIAGQACRSVGRATGSAVAAEMPLGALAHLLPADVGRERLDPVALFDAVVARFRDQAGGTVFVLLADDVHQLDITSLALLTQLVDADAVFLVGTLRTGDPIPDTVSALWRGGRVSRIDLTEFTTDTVEQLLCAVLGGPVEAGTAADFYSIGRGNVLFLRELVLGARASGRLVDDQGVWRLTGPPASTAALAELVEAALHNVDPQARPVLELLALVGVAGLGELTATASPELLEQLERAGLLTLRADRRRLQVTLAHPLYGEVLRAGMPLLTRRRVLREQADRVQRYGARRRGDPLRIASWRLDAEGTADAELLLTGARLARYGHDFEQVRRLATAALTEQVTIEGRLLLGEAQYELGCFEAAEEVLAAAEQTATSEADLVPIVSTRARNLAWGQLEPQRALDVIRNAGIQVRVADSALGCELLAIEARILGHAGRPAEALEVLAPLDGAGDRRTRVLRAVPLATALVLTGRSEDAVAVARQGFTDQAALSDQAAMVHPSTHLAIEVYGLTEAGRLGEAVERATSGRQLAVRDRSTIGRIWFAYHLGRCALLSGKLHTARRWFTEAVGLCRDRGYPWPRRLAATSLAAAAGAMGDLAGARQALRVAAEVGDIGYLRVEQELGPAWAAVAAGEIPEAREILLAAAREARDSQHLSSAAWLLHDVVRLGDPAAVRDQLAEVAGRSQGELVRVYAAHADAATRHDAERLSGVADRFAALGALLYAAEAAVSAGLAYQRQGNPRAAARLHAYSTSLVQLCEAPRTPGLISAASVTPLTPREREVAVLAAAGASSKEIAARLHVSIRTIDNHLQNAYGKLGVSKRSELAAALGVAGSDVS